MLKCSLKGCNVSHRMHKQACVFYKSRGNLKENWDFFASSWVSIADIWWRKENCLWSMSELRMTFLPLLCIRVALVVYHLSEGRDVSWEKCSAEASNYNGDLEKSKSHWNSLYLLMWYDCQFLGVGNRIIGPLLLWLIIVFLVQLLSGALAW